MSWADIKRRYEKSGGAATQSTEDLAARRILRALGLAEKTLWKAEKDTGLDNRVHAETTLLERATALARLKNSAFYPPPPVKDVRSFREAEDTVLELAEQRPYYDMARPVALVYRVKVGKSLRTLLYAGCNQFLDLTRTPFPCTLLKSRDGKAILCDCDAQDFYTLVLHTEAAHG